MATRLYEEHKVVAGALSVSITLAIALCILPGAAFAGQAADVWIQAPMGWEDRKSGLGHDLIKQVIAPQGVAVIEVYAGRGENPGLQKIADGMEQGMLARGDISTKPSVREQADHSGRS